MTRVSKAEKRKQRDVERVQRMKVSGMGVKAAIKRVGLPKSTYYHQRKHLGKPHVRDAYCYTQLTEREEHIIVDILQDFRNRGNPLHKSDIADAAELMLEQAEPARRAQLKWKGHRPGRCFVNLFLARHHEKIKLGRPTNQEDIRWRACNADTLTTHLASIEKEILDGKYAPSCIANLDESGVTPSRDISGRSSNKKVIAINTMATRQSAEKRVATFVNVDRITIMPVIFADGKHGPTLFITKGTTVATRLIDDGNNRNKLQTLLDCCPDDAILMTREKVAFCFVKWAEDFTAWLVKNKPGEKILLTYDGYRSHFGLKALDILKKGNVLAYCLPSHTSGMTQPLEKGVFGPLKQALRTEVDEAASLYHFPQFDVFDLFVLLTTACEKALTPANIRSAFNKSGLWPIDYRVYTTKPRPGNTTGTDMVSKEQFRALFEAKREAKRNGKNLQTAVIHRGSLKTTNGIVLNRGRAHELAVAQYEQRQRAETANLAQAGARELREQQVVERRREARLAHEQAAPARRVELYGVPNKAVRSLAVRRSVAKERTMQKRATERP